MDSVIQVLAHYWGIIVVVLALGLWALLDWKDFRQHVAGAIVYVEKHAEELALASGPDKHQWVVDQTWPVLPAWLKVFVTKERYDLIVEAIFQWLLSVAQKHQVQEVPMDKPPDAPTLQPAMPAPTEPTSPGTTPGAPDQPAAGVPPTSGGGAV